MANFLAEVDEALKQERVARFWNSYGGFVLGTALMIILGTAALSGYRVWDSGIKSAQTEKLLNALSAEDPASELISVSKDLRPGLKTLALWQAAGELVKKDDKAKALELYAQINKDPASPPDFRHLASFQMARLIAQSDPETGLSLLEKVANDESNPWNNLARLEVAVLQAHHKKNFKLAREHLATILKSESLPQSLERKARSLDMLYGLQEPQTQEDIAPAGGEQEQKPEKK
ncbi:MAG: hypothetical protein IPH06_04175 [Alphaproteobacteria bacterium]|jgi:hypothetical protein|nr:hypothetical protein [Alphaproteobacteria bacterium]QQS57227.1 MAG: hypothetical protein IPN28_13490 [Alphaproteobacteria bacterium]